MISVDADDVLRAYARERERRAACRALPLGVDRIQSSPEQESERWIELCLLVAGVPALAIEVYRLRVHGAAGHLLRAGLPEAIAPSDQAIALRLGIRRAEVGRLASQARALVGERMAARRGGG